MWSKAMAVIHTQGILLALSWKEEIMLRLV